MTQGRVQDLTIERLANIRRCEGPSTLLESASGYRRAVPVRGSGGRDDVTTPAPAGLLPQRDGADVQWSREWDNHRGGGGYCVVSSFDAIDHEWLIKFVKHRIADKRVVRHIKKWLNAGVLEDGEIRQAEEGTPQGGSISPLLANIYLHYAFDLWVHNWRRKYACGEVIVVRYADDFVMGFQYREDADRFRKELTERFRKFNLELHPTKTRLIEFGRHATENRSRRGEGKPETFTFLGLTHICGKTRRGKFTVIRQTMGKRIQAKLKELKKELRRRMHWPVPELGGWLRSVLRGHYQYYGVPHNGYALSSFRYQVIRLWFRTLQRRSQRTRLIWDRMKRLVKTWLPYPRIMHPYPEQRLRV